MDKRTAHVGIGLFLLALWANPAPAATYFAATNGHDTTGSGTIGAPFRTIQHALDLCSSGDVVEVRGGTYREAAEVRFRGPGVTLRSYTGEWAHIAAPMTNEDDYSSSVYLDPEADHTTLSRLEISGGYYYGIMLQTMWDWGDPLDRSGACHVTVEDCVIHDTGRDAIKLTPECDDFTLRRCEVYRSGVGPANIAAENAEGLDCVNSDRVLIQDCYFHQIYSMGIYLKGGATDGLIERTRVQGCGGGGILLGFDTSPEYFSTNVNPRYYENIRGTVRNCLITDTAWEGIGFYAASNAAAYNNTLVNVCTDGTHAAIYFGLTYQDWDPIAGRPSSVNPDIRNNLVVQPAGYYGDIFDIRYSEDLGGMSALQGWPSMDHNGYYVSGGEALFSDNRPGLELSQGSLAQWRTHAGTDAHSQTAAPQFMDQAVTNLKLRATSPYVNTGTNATWMTNATDLAGTNRIAQGIVDVGAYEFTGGGPTGRVIGFSSVASATNLPAAVIAKIRSLRWLFTHASVGGNIITGMNVLHTGDPARYPLAIYNYDGQNGDGDYHGAVATAGTEGGSDYRAASSPSATSNGVIYECMRGNPDWGNKLTCFSNSVVQSGWRFPKVNVAMDKFCWIDPYADPIQYCATLSNLEGRYPQTLIVYMTIPLTTETAGSENDDRNAFNKEVRSYCLANGKWMLDIADLQAWTTAGVQQTYLSSGVTNQQMYASYAVSAGDFHLNLAGRRQAALGWYALAGALFSTDRDGDGATDGDELLAGTSPTNATDVLKSSASLPASGRLTLQWPMVTGRVYAVEQTPTLAPAQWTSTVSGLIGTQLYTYTTAVSAADAVYYRLTAQQ